MFSYSYLYLSFCVSDSCPLGDQLLDDDCPGCLEMFLDSDDAMQTLPSFDDIIASIIGDVDCNNPLCLGTTCMCETKRTEADDQRHLVSQTNLFPENEARLSDDISRVCCRTTPDSVMIRIPDHDSYCEKVDRIGSKRKCDFDSDETDCSPKRRLRSNSSRDAMISDVSTSTSRKPFPNVQCAGADMSHAVGGEMDSGHRLV
jgi:hypothetical protein